MINPIDKASALANGTFNESAAQAGAAADAALNSLENSAAALLNSLPVIPDPELLKRQKEAEALEKIAEIQKKELELQEIGVEDIKKQILSLVVPALPIPLKIPLLSQKVLVAVILAKKEKILAELKQKKSKANLKKGKEAFSYPLKPPVPPPEEVEEVPPTIPQEPVPTPIPPPTRPKIASVSEEIKVKYYAELVGKNKVTWFLSDKSNFVRTVGNTDLLLLTATYSSAKSKEETIKAATETARTKGIDGNPPEADFVWPGGAKFSR